MEYEPCHEKPVFRVCDQVRLKPACLLSFRDKLSLEILDIETRGIIVSRQQTTKVLIRLRWCAGWSAPLLFAYGINKFSHDVAHIVWIKLVVNALMFPFAFQRQKILLKSPCNASSIGPRQANLVLIAYASSEGSGEPAHPHSLTRTSVACSYKLWVKRNLQTGSQIPVPSEWLGMRS